MPSASGDALLTALSPENLQTVLTCLSMTDRFALLSTSRTLLAEPIATTFASFCGVCAECAGKNPHLCKRKDNERPLSFWKCLLERSGVKALRELRLASCNAVTAELLRESPFTARALAGLHVLDLNRCDALGADGVRGW